MKWSRKKLEEIADFSLGKMLDQRKNKGELQPYLANLNVRWGGFELEDLRLMKFEEKEKERFGLKAGDIIMCEGGEIGRCAIWSDQIPNMMYQKALHRIRPYKDIDSRFLYYSFLQLGYTGGFSPYGTGSTIKHLPKEKLAKIEVNFPPLPTQRKISTILSAYDDLIENNLKRIKLLEEIAQRTYEDWFIKFRINSIQLKLNKETGLPEGWEKKRTDEIINLISGFAFKGVDLLDIPTRDIAVRMGNFKVGGGLKFEKSKYLKDGTIIKEKFRLKPMDLVMVLSDVTREGLLIGNVGFIPNDNNSYYLNQRVSKIEIKDELKFLAHSIFSSLSFKQNCLNKANSATVLNLKNEDVYGYELLLPEINVLKKWNTIYGDLIKNILNLEKQNIFLKESRDILLPRLMSGVIGVRTK